MEAVFTFFNNVYNSDFKFIIVLIFCIIAYLFIKFITPLFLKLSILSFGVNKDNEQIKKRVKTLTLLIDTTSSIIIIIYFIFFILQELSINIEPVLLGAGILTFPLAFGSQSLVKDIIAGIFIILENQYNLGDWVVVDSFEGKVVDINFRRTILQTPTGARHIIPNGYIGIVTNKTNTYSVVTLDLPLRLDANFDKINKVIDRVLRKLYKDKEFQESFMGEPERKGVNAIQDNAVVVRVWAKVQAKDKIKIKRELSNRIINEFSKKDIKLPGRMFK